MAQIVPFTIPMSPSSAVVSFGPPEGYRWHLLRATLVLVTSAAAGTRSVILDASLSLEQGKYGADRYLTTGDQSTVSSTFTASLATQSPGPTGLGRTLTLINRPPIFGHMDTLQLSPTLVSGDQWAFFAEFLEEEDGD